jgi:hypothetical protein
MLLSWLTAARQQPSLLRMIIHVLTPLKLPALTHRYTIYNSWHTGTTTWTLPCSRSPRQPEICHTVISILTMQRSMTPPRMSPRHLPLSHPIPPPSLRPRKPLRPRKQALYQIRDRSKFNYYIVIIGFNTVRSKKWTPPKLAGFIIGLLVFVVLVIVIICIYVRKRFRNRRPLNDSTELPTTTTPIGNFGPPGPLVPELIPLQPSQDLDSSPTAASGLTLPSLTTQDASKAEAAPAILDTPPATPLKDVDSVDPEATASEDPSHTSKQSACLSMNVSGTTCVETVKSAL